MIAHLFEGCKSILLSNIGFGLTAQIFHTLKLIMVFLKLSIICLSLINKKTRTMKADTFLKNFTVLSKRQILPSIIHSLRGETSRKEVFKRVYF